jgi:hypothetical protein
MTERDRDRRHETSVLAVIDERGSLFLVRETPMVAPQVA